MLKPKGYIGVFRFHVRIITQLAPTCLNFHDL